MGYFDNFKSGHYDINPLDRYLGLPDPGGEVMAKPTPGTTPGVSAEDQENSRQLMAMLAQYNQQYNQAFADQSRAAAGYGAVINGTAPSVAQGQLTQGLGAIQQAQQSAASGASGQNATIARIAAMQNTGQAQAQANQAAAIQRAAEIAQARDAQAKIYAQQAGQAGAMYGQNLTGAVGFAGPAAQTSIAADALKQKQFEQNRDFWANIMQSVGKGMMSGAA